jgi:hypothetical protein
MDTKARGKTQVGVCPKGGREQEEEEEEEKDISKQ